MGRKLLNYLYYRFVRPRRLCKTWGYVNRLPGQTLIDVGYFDGTVMRDIVRKDIAYFGIDAAPHEPLPGMPAQSLEDFATDKKFDIVVAFEMLEHTKDPVLAFRKLKAFAKKYICISVPHEPMNTLSRGFIPVPDHYWAISPNILKYYFGQPVFEKKIQFFRTYFAIFDVSCDTRQ